MNIAFDEILIDVYPVDEKHDRIMKSEAITREVMAGKNPNIIIDTNTHYESKNPKFSNIENLDGLYFVIIRHIVKSLNLVANQYIELTFRIGDDCYTFPKQDINEAVEITEKNIDGDKTENDFTENLSKFTEWCSTKCF